MTDLTEQWKKGELPSGWYYLKVDEELANYPVISECVDDYNLGLPLSYFYDFDVAKIEQVLAPVPSYEEWEQLQNWARFTDDYHALREQKEIAEYEIAGLKSELKEVCDVLIRKCPEMKEWVMLNWRKLYDCDKS